MFKWILILSIFTSTSALGDYHNLVYQTTSERRVVENSLYVLHGILVNAEIAKKKKLTVEQSLLKFDYVGFDKELSKMHPVLIYMTLKYFSDPIHEDKITAPVRKYLKESQVVPSLRSVVVAKPKYIDACLLYNKMKIKTEKDFRQAVKEIVEFLSTVRA